MRVPNSNATLQKIADFYLMSDDFRRLKGSTQRDYETNINKAIETVVEGRKLKNYRCHELLVRHFIQAYDKWLEVGTRTANYRKAALHVAWRHAMRYDVMTADPISLIKTKQTGPRKVYWSRDQIKTFLGVAYSQFKWRNIGLLVHMSYDWGQRVGDMRTLTWDTLNLDECKLSLTQSKRNAGVNLPISKSLCQMLRNQKEDFGFQKYVVPKVYASDGSFKPYTKHEISILINDVLEEANLPLELTAMDLRRTAVTEMMEAGVSESNIMQVTGHRSLNSMMPYRVNTFSGASKALEARGNDDD